MKPSPDLHELIHSMNGSEKRFFQFFSGRHGGEGSYRSLFQEIASQKRYEEVLVKGGKKFFAAEKNYLHEAILDSLAIYHRDKSYLARHAAKLVQIELLYKRGLFAQCMKQIRKAKSTGYKQELYPFLLMFLRWETIIHIKNEDVEHLEKNLEEEIRLNEVLRIQYALMQLAFLVQIRIEKGGIDKRYIDEQKAKLQSFFPIPSHLNSFWTSYYYYSTLGLLASAESDHDTRYHAFLSVKATMEAAPIFIRDLPGIYHLNMNNLINVTFRLEKYDEASTMLAEQRNFMGKYGVRNITLGRIMFLNTSENELFLHYKTGQTEKGMYFLRSIEKTIMGTPVSFSPLVFDVLFMMASVAFVGNDLRSAAKYLNRMFNEEKIGKIRPELMITARLLYLVVLFEGGDILFESRYQSTRRLLRRYSHFQHYSQFADLLNMAHERRTAESAFHEKLETLYKEKVRFTEDEANKQFDFISWARQRFAPRS